MKRKTITLISLILSLLMVMSVFSVVSVSAEVISGTDEVNGISWAWDTDTKTLTVEGEGAYPAYEYPDLEPWFEYAHDVKVLELGYGFTSVPAHAFETVYSDLEDVTLPSSLTTIGEQAFSNCDSLKTIDFGGAVEIGDRAFQYTGLKSVTLPYTIEKVGKMAFDECRSLSSVYLADVKSVGELAFADTSMLSVTLPDSLEDIGNKAFGYFYDELDDGEGTSALYNWYPLEWFEIHASDDNLFAAKYAEDNGFTLCVGAASISPKTVSIKAGGKKKLTVKNGAVTAWDWTSSKSSVAKYKFENGYVYGLKKGTATITGTTVSGTPLKVKVTVTTNPKITVGGRAYKSGKTFAVKKGKKLAVKITGKSDIVKNKYTSSKPKVAKVISKTTVKTAYIEGYKKGTTTIKMTVNGVLFKFKVKVK